MATLVVSDDLLLALMVLVLIADALAEEEKV